MIQVRTRRHYLILFAVLCLFFWLGWGNLQRKVDRMTYRSSKNAVAAEVSSLKGMLRRQTIDSLVFFRADVGEEIRFGDLLVTGPDSEALIRFNDKVLIKMMPGTLMSISEENFEKLGKIDRRLLINIYVGEAQAKEVPAGTRVALQRQPSDGAPFEVVYENDLTPPIAAVEPLVVPNETAPPVVPTTPVEPNWILPRSNAQLQLEPTQEPPFRLGYQLELAPEDPLPVGYTLQLVGESSESIRVPLLFEGQKAQGFVNLKLPGDKTLELRNEANKVISKTMVTLSPFIDRLILSNPLLNGQEFNSNAYRKLSTKDKITLTLRWQPLQDQKKYQLVLFDGLKIISRKDVDGLQFDLSDRSLLERAVRYRVVSKLPNGFTARSAEGLFSFNFRSPALTLPEPDATMEASKDGILFTWQRTLFTKEYSFELGVNPKFEPVVKELKIGENFLVFKNLVPGTYYWRVRSISDSQQSAYGEVRKIVVTPAPEPIKN